jgi:gliding motility-associated-like protein
MNNVPVSEDTNYLNNLAAGNYDFTVTDANLCHATWNGSLLQPESLSLNIHTKNVNCTGSKLGTAKAMVSGGIVPYVYEWSNGASDDSIYNLNTGQYTLLVKDLNMCAVDDTFEISQNTEVQIEILTDNPISCHNLSDGILRAEARDGVPPYIYKWQEGPQNSTYAGLSQGEYHVTVSDNDGCIGDQSIVLNDPDPLIPLIDITHVQCYNGEDGSLLLNATGGSGLYDYYFGGIKISGNSINELKAGKYALKVADSKECESDTSIFITQPARLSIAVDRQNTISPFCPDWQNGVLTISVSGGTRSYTYNWEGYSSQDSVLSNIKQDVYKVTVTDAHNCVTDTTIRFKALHDNCLGIPSAFTPNYDNFNDSWEIRYMTEDGQEILFNEVYPYGEIKIYDRIGNLVYHCSGGCPEDWKGEDNQGRKLPVDTYYFIIDLNNEDNKEPLKGIVTIIR